MDTKEQLTEAGTAAFMLPVPTWDRSWGVDPPGPELGASLPVSLDLPRKVLLPPGTDGETEAWELSDPSKVPQPGQQGGD